MYFQCAILLPRLYGRPGLRQLACAFPTQPCAGPLLQRALQAEPDNLLCGTRRLGGRPAAGTRELDAVLREKNIPAWIDYWGKDVSHDWVWWQRQIVYFFDKILPWK